MNHVNARHGSIRAMSTPNDRSFVVSNWAATFRTAFAAGMIAMEDWDSVMYPQIEKVLGRAGTKTVVAFDADGPIGFIAANPTEKPPHVFYVYVQQDARKQHVARALFDAVGINPDMPFGYTCKTRVLSDLARKIPMAQWRPLIARFPTTKDYSRER